MRCHIPPFLILVLSTQVFGQDQCDQNNIGCTTPIEFNGSSSPRSTSSYCVINTIPSPTSGTSSLAFDGTDLWVGAYPDHIIKVSPQNGTVLKTLYTGIQRPYGLEFVDGYLWVTDNQLHTVNKVDTSNGNTILSHVTLGQSDETGLAWDGVQLWHCSRGTNSMSYIDTVTGTGLTSIPIDLVFPSALAFQGAHLWVSDNSSHKVYKMDTTTFLFVDTIDSPRDYPNGIAFDGQYLWIAENENSSGIDSIYQIDLNCNPTYIRANELANDLNIYPNPTAGGLSIDLRETAEAVTITIADLRGRVIRSHRYSSKQLLNLDIAEPPGIYLLIIGSGDGKEVIKLIKE